MIVFLGRIADEIRITKAQTFDTLSSMSNILGYRAVLEAFYHFDGMSRSIVSSAGKVYYF